MSEDTNTKVEATVENSTKEESFASPETLSDSDKLINELRQQAEKNKNDFLYLRAEFDTYKRNAIKERSDLVKYASEALWKDILHTMDNFDRAIESATQNPDSLLKGLELTLKEFKSLLSKYNVTEVHCEGAAFDPTLHEALSTEAHPDIPSGHITKVFKKAYTLHDRMLRPAQVVVSKGTT